jgi:hypothetical protein
MEVTMQCVTGAVLIAATALLLTQSVRADSTIESDDPYEAAYLASCGRQLPPDSCRCAMEVIEDTLSFDKFAALVAHFGGDIRRVLPADRVDPAVEQSCGVAGLSISPTTTMTQRVKPAR